MSIGRIQSTSHVGRCRVQLINVFKVHWDALVKDALEAWGEDSADYFFLLPQCVID